jgi:hypothetical protein
MVRERNSLRLGGTIFHAGLLRLGLGLLVGVRAQTTTAGNVSGTVRDSAGAVIPRAEVVIQEETTGFSRTVITSDEGFYSAPGLPVGRYSVSAAPQGFKKTVNTGIDLHLGENLVVNLGVELCNPPQFRTSHT